MGGVRGGCLPYFSSSILDAKTWQRHPRSSSPTGGPHPSAHAGRGSGDYREQSAGGETWPGSQSDLTTRIFLSLNFPVEIVPGNTTGRFNDRKMKTHDANQDRSSSFWSAATCRRFPILWRSRFPSVARSQAKSGSAANESCDKSQQSRCAETSCIFAPAYFCLAVGAAASCPATEAVSSGEHNWR